MGSEDVDRVAAGQHGVITLDQLVGWRVSAGSVKRWLAAGRLVALHRGVYRLAGAPATAHQRLLAAVLAAGPGAVASHRAAASVWQLLGTGAVELSVPRGRLPRVAGAVVHRSGDLEARWCRRHLGIPVTSPVRTLVDLGAVVRPAVVEDALDRALVARLVSVAAVEDAVTALGARGRAGAGVLKVVLEQRALGADRPDGLLEPRMARLLRDAGLPAPAFQHHVGTGGRVVARVDFAYPAARLALEVDGSDSHSSPRALQDDLERQNHLVVLGWTVLRFTWADVVRRPETVAARVRQVLGTLRTA